jgi:hypothetical protein
VAYFKVPPNTCQARLMNSIRQSSVMMAGNTVKIRTRYLLNMNLECKCYTNLIGTDEKVILKKYVKKTNCKEMKLI